MTKNDCYLGIDLSTTSAKALLIDTAGTIRASASHSLTVSSPRPLWSEQNPQEWWEATAECLRQVAAEAKAAGLILRGVGLTGQMHGLVLLDSRGEVLRPAILWNDQRTAEECDLIRARFGREQLIQVSGNDALTGFTSPKIIWVQRHEPEIWRKARHILLPKDYIRYRLTGGFAMDKADGSGTGLFDLAQRSWSRDIISALEIPAEYLPPTFEGPETTGLVSAGAAAETGLPAGLPVAAGGGDQAAQAVGVGAVEEGLAALTLGTSGVTFLSTRRPLPEKEGRLHAFCHAVPDMWHLMGVMLSAAGSLQWFHDAFAPREDFNALMEEAAAVPAGSEGLLFLPYLTGERTPYPDPYARGAWIGLTVRHSRAHMIRAILEGVAFGLKDNLELLKSSGVDQIQNLRASGGGTKSALWRQILANVLQMDLEMVNSTEGAALGAAILAGVGGGAWKTVPQACAQLIHTAGQTSPDNSGNIYPEMYDQYRSLYPVLAPHFHRLSALSLRE